MVELFYFQYDSEGTPQLVDGPVLVNNDRVLLKSKTFRLNYPAQSSDVHRFLVVVENNFDSTPREQTFEFNSKDNSDDNRGNTIHPTSLLPYCELATNALLRRDYAKFCKIYKNYGKDKYILAALAYNIGFGAVNKSSVLKKLKAGDRNIFKAYTCHYKSKWYKEPYTSRLTEITALFIP